MATFPFGARFRQVFYCILLVRVLAVSEVYEERAMGRQPPSYEFGKYQYILGSKLALISRKSYYVVIEYQKQKY